MTRINLHIPVANLTDEHLLAEHREIKRLPSLFGKRAVSGRFDDIPPMFTLGLGHARFFLDKGKYTLFRYQQLYDECLRRHFIVQYYGGNWGVYDNYPQLFNDYEPLPQDLALVANRVIERIRFSPKLYWHYYGKPVSKDEAVLILLKNNDLHVV